MIVLFLEGFAGEAGGPPETPRLLAIRFFAINLGLELVDVALGERLPIGPHLSFTAPPPLPSLSSNGYPLFQIPHGGGWGNSENVSPGSHFAL